MLTRRTFDKVLMVAVGGLLIPTAAMADDNVSVQIRTDQVVANTIPMIIRKKLVISPDDSEISRQLALRKPPSRSEIAIFIIAGVFTIERVWEVINEMLRQQHYGGVSIDYRQSPPMITSDPMIPAHKLFVISPDGKVQVFDSAAFSLDTIFKLFGR